MQPIVPQERMIASVSATREGANRGGTRHDFKDFAIVDAPYPLQKFGNGKRNIGFARLRLEIFELTKLPHRKPLRHASGHAFGHRLRQAAGVGG